MRTIIVLAALTLSTLPAAPALAADEVRTIVPYADLNLAAPAGAAALEQRIEAAVREVCARPDIRNLKAMTAWEECKITARIGALEQLSIGSRYEGLELVSIF